MNKHVVSTSLISKLLSNVRDSAKPDKIYALLESLPKPGSYSLAGTNWHSFVTTKTRSNIWEASVTIQKKDGMVHIQIDRVPEFIYLSVQSPEHPEDRIFIKADKPHAKWHTHS